MDRYIDTSTYSIMIAAFVCIFVGVLSKYGLEKWFLPEDPEMNTSLYYVPLGLFSGIFTLFVCKFWKTRGDYRVFTEPY